MVHKVEDVADASLGGMVVVDDVGAKSHSVVEALTHYYDAVLHLHEHALHLGHAHGKCVSSGERL